MNELNSVPTGKVWSANRTVSKENSMPDEIKKCPFCGSSVEDLNPEQIKHPWVNGCPMAHVIEWKSDWNRRSSISLETAQKLAERIGCSCGVEYDMCESCSNALAKFNAEKDKS